MTELPIDRELLELGLTNQNSKLIEAVKKVRHKYSPLAKIKYPEPLEVFVYGGQEYVCLQRYWIENQMILTEAYLKLADYPASIFIVPYYWFNSKSKFDI